MGAAPPILALDIGATKVACAIGLANEGGGFELLGTSLIAYPGLAEAWLSDLLLVSRTIEQAVEATAVTGDLHRALVAVSHPAVQSEQIRASLRLGDEPVTIRTQDLARLEATALDRALGIDREALLVERLGCSGNGFSDVRDPRGLAATRVFGVFHVLTLPLAARRALVQAVEGAGLEVAELHHTLRAAFAGLAEPALGHQRALLIDASGLKTDVGLFSDGRLEAAAVLPGGAAQLVLRIASELRVTVDQAVAWTLEGAACRKPAVRSLLEQHWAKLQHEIEQLLAGRPTPDVVVAGGRAALADGFLERLERATGVPARLCRSPRTQAMQDVPRQVGLIAAIGLLEAACGASHPIAPPSHHFFNRLVRGTKTLLLEYF